MTDSVKARRSYHSPKRKQQLAATRRRILEAAQHLFVERGYAATTVEAISAAADVAVPTLYVTVGGKRGIVGALLETMEQTVNVVDQYAAAVAEPDPRRRLRLVAGIHRAFVERYTELGEVLRTAAATDPEVADAWRVGEGHRHRDQVMVVHSLARDGALRARLDEAHAADVLWFITGPETHRHLVMNRGWDLQTYETWLGEAMAQLLLP
jgi:AcrR family transcriptional regulator